MKKLTDRQIYVEDWIVLGAFVLIVFLALAWR